MTTIDRDIITDRVHPLARKAIEILVAAVKLCLAGALTTGLLTRFIYTNVVPAHLMEQTVVLVLHGSLRRHREGATHAQIAAA